MCPINQDLIIKDFKFWEFEDFLIIQIFFFLSLTINKIKLKQAENTANFVIKSIKHGNVFNIF